MTASQPSNEYIGRIQAARELARENLRSPRSVLAAVARHDLPINSRTRFGPLHGDADVRLPDLRRVIEITPTERGFRVDGESVAAGLIKADRYTLRLSHQGYPAAVVLDRESPRLQEPVELRWWPVDPRMRFRARLEPDGERMRIGSTATSDRDVERVGWLSLVIDGLAVRVLVTRLLEPGAEGMDIYFRDATTGHDSYEVGRYVGVEREGDLYVVDFNLAYNPSCALSPYYNCPIPPRENHLAVPIRAGEMSPLVKSAAAHG